MSKAERTKQFIIATTSELFNKKGYNNTSLSDITDITGLTKGSVYGNFSNKEAVAKAVYKFNAKRIGKELMDAVSAVNGTAADQLDAIISYYRANWTVLSSRGGCPLLNAATEADDTFPELTLAVQRSFKSFENMLVEIVEKGKKQKTFRQDVDSKSFAASFIMLLEGGILLAKTYSNDSYLEISLKTLNERILGIKR